MSWLRSVSTCALVAGALLLVPMGTAVAQRVPEGRRSRRLRATLPARAISQYRSASPAGFEPRTARRAEAFGQGCAQRADHPAGRRRLRPGRHLRRRQSIPRRSASSPTRASAYNAFHTTAICSPTRAALLTGRNHHRVGIGTIAERAVDWDGYTGVIPKSSATIAEVLRHYGYKTAAFGKWHNTPAERDHRDGAVRPLADRLRLRLFLRLPRRRDLAVGAAAGRKHQRRSSRRTTRNTT